MMRDRYRPFDDPFATIILTLVDAPKRSASTLNIQHSILNFQVFVIQRRFRLLEHLELSVECFSAYQAILGGIHIDFRYGKIVVLPIVPFGAQSLQPFGLRPMCLLSYA